MAKRSTVDSLLVNRRMEELINSEPNRYSATVKVANRAKSRCYREQEEQDQGVKPIVQAILEIAEEKSQPQILSD